MIRSISYTLLESKSIYYPVPELMSQLSGLSKLVATLVASPCAKANHTLDHFSDGVLRHEKWLVVLRPHAFQVATLRRTRCVLRTPLALSSRLTLNDASLSLFGHFHEFYDVLSLDAWRAAPYHRRLLLSSA